MFTLKRVFSAVAVLTLLVTVALPASPSNAVESQVCPEGWSPVPDQDLDVTLFCYLPDSGPGTYDDIHVVIVGQAQVGQYTRDPNNPNDLYGAYGSPSDPNPLFLKRSVKGHLRDYHSDDSNIRMAINGMHFKCTYFCPNNSTYLSAPSWRAGLVNTGWDISGTRLCFAWGSDPADPPTISSWTNITSDWTDVETEMASCGSSIAVPTHKVVSYLLEPPGEDARTYIAYRQPTRELCFLVGGKLGPGQAANMLMTVFACGSPLQMDGGKSSQLSFVNTDDEIVNPVNGPEPYAYRDVPHYFVIWG